MTKTKGRTTSMTEYEPVWERPKKLGDKITFALAAALPLELEWVGSGSDLRTGARDAQYETEDGLVVTIKVEHKK